MKNVSNEYIQGIASNQRKMHIKITLSTGLEITGNDELISFTISEVSNAGDRLTMGNVCCNQADITLFYPSTPVAFTNEKITLYSGLEINDEIEWACLGDYYVHEIKTDNKQKQISITAYDSMYRCNEEYIPSITYPALMEDVVKDICQVARISLKETEFPLMEIPFVEENCTCKELLGYMAGLLGKNAYINYQNELEFYWYTPSDVTITRDLQYQDSFTVTGNHITITSVTSGTDKQVLVSGQGYGISFTNPYITQEIVDEICQHIQGFTYLPCTLKWRGNPALTVQDIVLVEDQTGTMHQVLLTENKTMYGAGMNSDITCVGKREEDVVVAKGPTDIKLNKLYTTLANAFKKSTETILGHNGGYFTIDMNEEGFPCGWTIMDTPTLREDTKLWKMNEKGLGYSNDGGKTLRNIAIDLNGNITANSITTGILQGNHFALDLEEGTLVLGSRDEEGELNSEWLRADKNGLFIKAMQEVGSANLFKDSMGVFNDTFEKSSWIGTFDIDASIDVKNRNIYGYGILLKNDTLSQSINIPNGLYTVSFLYKKHISLSNVSVKINNIQKKLSNTDYTLITETIQVNSNQLTIEFTSDTDDACTIVNLMANQGETPSVWCLAPGETWDEYVRIGRGIEIGNQNTKVVFKALADHIGFKSNTTGEFVSIFTEVGLETDELNVKNKAEIVKLLIQDISNQTVINRISGKN